VKLQQKYPLYLLLHESNSTTQGIILEYWCPTRLPYQTMIVSFDSNTTGVTSGAGTTSPIRAPVFIFCFVLGTYCSILYFSRMLV